MKSVQGPIWLLTRAREECAETLAALTERGIDARPLPCIERVALSWPRALVPAPEGRTLAFVTSPFAARIVIDHTEPAWRRAVVFGAIAPATVSVLERAGLSVPVQAHGGAEALAHAVVVEASREPLRRVLYPTSDVGLRTPEQARALAVLSTVTDDLRRAAVYETRGSTGLREAVRTLPREIGLVFFSPSAVDAFLDATHGAPSMHPRALCVGASTARAWNARASAPARTLARDESLLDAITSIHREPHDRARDDR
jgi:uroporphyrinogen-III synthase